MDRICLLPLAGPFRGYIGNALYRLDLRVKSTARRKFTIYSLRRKNGPCNFRYCVRNFYFLTATKVFSDRKKLTATAPTTNIKTPPANDAAFRLIKSIARLPAGASRLCVSFTAIRSLTAANKYGFEIILSISLERVAPLSTSFLPIVSSVLLSKIVFRISQ